MSTIVLIHGIWMTGIDMSLLRYRLRRYGYQTVQFSYSSIRRDLKQNAERLKRMVEKIDDDNIHFVAHSLGGLLIRQFFHDFPIQKPGRIVTLATPHQGSLVAKRMADQRWGKLLLGKSLQQGLTGDVPAWTSEHEIGVIAGSAKLGVGMMLAHLPKPHDGTVALVETRLQGMTDYLVMPVSHSAMVLSASVAQQIHTFLKNGRFEH